MVFPPDVGSGIITIRGIVIRISDMGSQIKIDFADSTGFELKVFFLTWWSFSGIL